MLWRRRRETTRISRIDEDGYLSRGRADDVIISADGTSAVEKNTLLKHDDVMEVAVIGVPDATRGKWSRHSWPHARQQAFVDELKIYAGAAEPARIPAAYRICE
jgi:acetyl-CoA synthetase